MPDPTRFHHFGPKTLRKRGKHGSVFQQILSQMISRNHGCFTGKSLSNSQKLTEISSKKSVRSSMGYTQWFRDGQNFSPRGPKSLSVKICLVDPFKNHRTHLKRDTVTPFSGHPEVISPFSKWPQKIHRYSPIDNCSIFGFWLSGELNTNQKMIKILFKKLPSGSMPY